MHTVYKYTNKQTEITANQGTAKWQQRQCRHENERATTEMMRTTTLYANVQPVRHGRPMPTTDSCMPACIRDGNTFLPAHHPTAAAAAATSTHQTLKPIANPLTPVGITDHNYPTSLSTQIMFCILHTHWPLQQQQQQQQHQLTAVCPVLRGWIVTRKVKPSWMLLKQETVSGSGISWTSLHLASDS